MGAWEQLSQEVARFRAEVADLQVTQPVRPSEIESELHSRFDFDRPQELPAVMDHVAELIRKWSLHVTHPRYFGLFNPSVREASIMADALVALYNPQVGAWAHAPLANEMERMVLHAVFERMGLDCVTGAAQFTSGGSEANFSAVLTALTHAFPEFSQQGTRGLSAPPTLYVSAEGHHSFEKIAHQTGLGRVAVRNVPVDEKLRMNPHALDQALARDRSEGLAPFMVVGTAGTTGPGTLDPLRDLSAVAQQHDLWFHVDAAWGGAAALSPKLRPHLDGIESADSVTLDAHKWLSVPVGAGMFWAKDQDLVRQAFNVDTPYVPEETEGRPDLYRASAQWSRRCIGMKLFFALATSGTEGIARDLDHQAAMGDLLREKLVAAGWELTNDTPFPLVCFTHEKFRSGQRDLDAAVKSIQARGDVWISLVRLHPDVLSMRACITSFDTQASDLDRLVDEIRKEVA